MGPGCVWPDGSSLDLRKSSHRARGHHQGLSVPVGAAGEGGRQGVCVSGRSHLPNKHS